MEMIDELFATGKFSVGGENADPRFVDLGEEQITGPRRMAWTGRASEFESIARSRFERWDTERLFRYGNSAGMLLRSLSMKNPERVEADTMVRGQQRWTIYPPPTARQVEAAGPLVTTEVDARSDTGTLLRRLAERSLDLE